MKTFYLVYDNCDCDSDVCCGKENIAVFESEQTAKQEADLRSQRWGGYKNRPDMHMQKITLSTKISKY